MEVGVPRTYYGVVYQLDYDDLYLWGVGEEEVPRCDE
jgi:hypothetical protein